MPTLAAPLDLAKLEARNFRAHILGTAPSSPVTGQMYYNSGDNTLYWWNGTTWVAAQGAGGGALTDGDKGDITVSGGGASWVIDASAVTTAKIGDSQVTSLKIADGTIVDGDVAAANKDGAAGTPSMRTLGTGAAQALAGNTRLDQITAPTASVSFNNQKATLLADPTVGTDGANKQYVDSIAQGLSPKTSVRMASTANLSLTGAATVDTIAAVTGDRVLAKNQTTPAQNGIWIANTAGAWTRATDMDSWAEVPGASTWVNEGSVNVDTGWVSTANQGGTLGTTAITWTQNSGLGDITDGAGLTKTGNVLDVNVDGSSIEINADILRVKALGITNAMLAGSIDLTAKVTGALPIANGGTGQTTAKAARETGLAAAGYYSTATHGAGTTINILQATHGLRASMGLIVQVQDAASGVVELADVAVNTGGDVSVGFGASVGANSKRITITG